jgi:YD repeat-containing protein
MTPRFYANARPKRFTGIVVIFCLFLSVSAFILGGQAFACPPPGDGPPENPPTEVGDPVSVTSGKVRSPQRDLLIPGRGGLSLEISRNYYSKSGYAGPFGRGWSFTYGMNITQETTTTTVLINEKGKKEEYTWDGNSWSPPASNFSTLTKNQDNTWTLRRKVAMAYNFDTEGKPINIKDRNDNRINLVYANGLLASVTDDNGRSLIFSCTDGKITSITWPNNEVTAYTYHPDSGNLAAVTDPEGNQESYAY